MSGRERFGGLVSRHIRTQSLHYEDEQPKRLKPKTELDANLLVDSAHLDHPCDSLGQLPGNTFHQWNHSFIVVVVTWDDPYHAQRIHQRRQRVNHNLHETTMKPHCIHVFIVPLFSVFCIQHTVKMFTNLKSGPMCDILEVPLQSGQKSHVVFCFCVILAQILLQVFNGIVSVAEDLQQLFNFWQFELLEECAQSRVPFPPVVNLRQRSIALGSLKEI